MQRSPAQDAQRQFRADGIHEFEPSLAGNHLRVGIVMARFNLGICEGLLSACVDELIQLGVSRDGIRIATVPGALEIPLALQAMGKSGNYDALIGLGAVIRGDTYHFELVANEIGAGVTRVALDTRLPIANGVLTTENEDQAIARMRDKGVDCARAAVEMGNLLKVLK